MCYEDNCEVLIPSGYPLTFDEDHQTKLYSRNWLGSVDYLTEFWFTYVCVIDQN